MLILSFESGSMCRHQGSSELSGSYTTLQFFTAEQNPVWNKTLQHILLGKNENYSSEKEGFLYASLPPPFCQKQGKWKQRK